MAIINENILDPAIAAGQTGLERAVGASEQDLQALAQGKTELLRGMLAPEQEQKRKALEARLLAQGRLGSTGGAEQQAALERAIGQQDLQAQLAGLELAQAERQQQYQMGLGLAELGTGLATREAGFGLEQQQLDLARQQFEWQKRQARKRRGGFLSNLLRGVVSAGATALGGPLVGGLAGAIFGAGDKGEGPTGWAGFKQGFLSDLNRQRGG